MPHWVKGVINCFAVVNNTKVHVCLVDSVVCVYFSAVCVFKGRELVEGESRTIRDDGMCLLLQCRVSSL